MPRESRRVSDPALLAQRPLPVVAAVPPQAIEYLFACCIADQSLLRDAQQFLRPHHFELHERPLSLTWAVMLEAAQNNWQITFELLQCQLASRCQLDPGIVTPDQYDVMMLPGPDGLFWSLTHPVTPMTPQTLSFGRKILQSLTYERTVANPLRRMAASHYGDGTVGEMGEALDVIQQQQSRIATMEVLPVVASTMARGTAAKPASEYLPIGIPWIDRAIQGDRPGDANGLLGPTGGGKTTCAMQMAVSTARFSYSDAMRQGQTPPMTVYVTLEEAVTKLRPRMWSVAFQIPRTKLDTMGSDWSRLTTANNLDPYERELLGGSAEYPAMPLSETERWDTESAWLDRSLVLLDLSGSEDFPNAGRGGVGEIVSYLDRLQSQRQQPLRAVYIDYAGLLVSAMADMHSVTDVAAKRSLLKGLGMECRRQISERFHCTTWLIHQMAGATGKSSATRLLTHTDAGDCKDFAENLVVCGCLGTEDKSNGCRRLNWSKLRTTVSTAAPPITLRIHERFAMMEDVTALFTPDMAHGVFLSADEARRIEGMSAAPRRQAGPRGLSVGIDGPSLNIVDAPT